MKNLVMFDVDGTLVDSCGFDGVLYARAVREVLKIEVDETWASYRNVTDSGILEELLVQYRGGSSAEDARSAVKRLFVELTSDHIARRPSAIREIPGARALVDALITIPDVCVAVATGGWHETASLKLRAIGLAVEEFALATASDSVERTKIMQLAEQRAMRGHVPVRRTYFGDGSWDKRAAAELGYRFIGVGGRVEHNLLFGDFNDRQAVLACLAA